MGGKADDFENKRADEDRPEYILGENGNTEM